MKPFWIFFFVLIGYGLSAQQSPYFPPISGNNWSTVSTSDLGWTQDSLQSLQQYLEDQNTKAFIILVDGKIAVEWYFDNFTPDSVWYWASAGKSLTSFIIGMAQEQGFLDLDEPTSLYLGSGWTNLPGSQEDSITVLDQLSMTTGLDDGVSNPDCTNPQCLQYKAPAGTRWAYHNAPYTLLHDVFSNATGQSINTFFLSQVTPKTGITGAFVNLGNNRVFFSKARSMARFGLLVSQKGIWENDTILRDSVFLEQMISPSQNLNESYGYLWWLNGQPNHMLPGLQFVFPGELVPNAPGDMVMALGRDDQKLYIVPSSGMVVIRLGNPSNATLPGPSGFDNDLWARLSILENSLGTDDPVQIEQPRLYPNPSNDVIHIECNQSGEFQIIDSSGRIVKKGIHQSGLNAIAVGSISPGKYMVVFENSAILWIKN